MRTYFFVLFTVCVSSSTCVAWTRLLECYNEGAPIESVSLYTRGEVFRLLEKPREGELVGREISRTEWEEKTIYLKASGWKKAVIFKTEGQWQYVFQTPNEFIQSSTLCSEY